MKKLLIAISSIVLFGCTNPKGATDVLTKEGYSQIELTGYGWLDCSEDDFYATRFKAMKNGQEIEGCVCQGIFKGKTIRLD